MGMLIAGAGGGPDGAGGPRGSASLSARAALCPPLYTQGLLVRVLAKGAGEPRDQFFSVCFFGSHETELSFPQVRLEPVCLVPR